METKPNVHLLRHSSVLSDVSNLGLELGTLGVVKASKTVLTFLESKFVTCHAVGYSSLVSYVLCL